MKHTKGPWQLSEIPFELRSNDSAASIYGPNILNNGACFIADISRSAGDKQATANAKLIAAAPELLEALQWFIDEFEPMKAYHREYFEKAKVAIKKATE